ncbi:MAG: hypothetical protein ABIP79_10415 [Chitinophagaceae bacterium]
MKFLKSIQKRVFFFSILLTLVSSAVGRDYYVDAMNGSDNNNGISAKTAWKSLDKVSNAIYLPGDKISFKSGQRFEGMLTISSSGKEGLPLTFTTFGGKEPAIIDGKGGSAAVYSHNKEYIVLSNLAVTNFREGTITIDDLFNGIYIVNEDAGTLHNFHFDNIKVFNVNSTHIFPDEGKTDKSRFHGGVQFYTIGNKVRSNFDDVLITNSTFENLGRTGFNFRSDWDDRSANSKFGDDIGKGRTDNWTPNTNVIIRKNYFKNIAGNALIVRVAVDPLVEHNLFDSCGKYISGNATFNFNTDGTIFQFNEAKNTIYSEGETDARGIDSDYKTKNTIIQYNYLHHNGLGGVTAVGGPGVGEEPVYFNIGTIIRYNILENNQRQGAYFSGRVEGLQMYNNVIYADATINDVVAIKLNRWTVYPNNARFSNNIFYFEGKNISYDFTQATNVVFDHNIYMGINPPQKFSDIFPIKADPLFRAKGTGRLGYQLLKNSPAFNAGVIIKNNPEVDFYGNKIINIAALNIGADNNRNLK